MADRQEKSKIFGSERNAIIIEYSILRAPRPVIVSSIAHKFITASERG